LGPLAMVYLGADPDPAASSELGERLARKCGVPLVLDAKSLPLRGWSSEGPFLLPRDADKILGNHPFREQLLPDLERLCGHEYAGDLILLGWKAGIKHPVSFAVENGAHGGISPEECSAFVLLPQDAARELLPTAALRPADLRRAALVFQGRLPRPLSLSASPFQQETRSIRVMTYNVHSCVGLDGHHDPGRIARVIARCHPDVVALQELETGKARSEGVHQAKQIAERLRFEYHFHSVRELEDEQFGNAVLSRFPIKLLRAGALPSLGGRRGSETRGALWVELDVDGKPVQVLNTHFGLRARERLWQARALLGERWLGGVDRRVPIILCGDLNCGPKSQPYRELLEFFPDGLPGAHGQKPKNTWPTRLPIARLDHILLRAPLAPLRITVPTFQLAVTASDHFPVVADIAFPGGEKHVA